MLRLQEVAFSTLAIVAASLPAVGFANSLTPAIQFDPFSPEGNFASLAGNLLPDGHTAGWGFELTESARLEGVGMFDVGGDGLNGSHLISLWRLDLSSGQLFGGDDELLLSTIIEKGSGAPLQDGFRTADVSSSVLTPGRYAVGAAALPELPSSPPLLDLLTPYLEDPSFYFDDPILMDLYPFPDQDVYYYNFDFGFGPGRPDTVRVDPRVDLTLSFPYRSSTPGLVPMDNPLLVNGAFVGPNLYFVPIPEPATVALILVASVGVAFTRGAYSGVHR